MTHTASSIIEMSMSGKRISDRQYPFSDPEPAFARGVFSTHNWCDPAVSLIRRFCERAEELAHERDLADPPVYLNGDAEFDDKCWFDWSVNHARYGFHINGFDIVIFEFQDTTFVFFVGEYQTYFVQWYKRRGRTKWILSIEGLNMGTAEPVYAGQYASLLNAIEGFDLNKAVPITTGYEIDYDFWWIAVLEQREAK